LVRSRSGCFSPTWRNSFKPGQYSSGQRLLSVTDTAMPTASRCPFHVKPSEPSLAGWCPVSDVMVIEAGGPLDAWQSISEPGVLEGCAGDRQRSPVFAGSLRNAQQRGAFRGVRTSGTSQRNETWTWDLVCRTRNSPPISMPGSAPRRVLVVAESAAIGLLLGLAMHPPGHGSTRRISGSAH